MWASLHPEAALKHNRTDMYTLSPPQLTSKHAPADVQRRDMGAEAVCYGTFATSAGLRLTSEPSSG